MEGEEVPSYFLCPISLQLMKDPVTLSTGITYDRDSIEHWIFASRRSTCPVSRKILPDSEILTPNHTLRRLIRSWCSLNGVAKQLPTVNLPVVDAARVAELLELHPLAALRQLRAVVDESERGKRCVEAASGAVDFLASFVVAGEEAHSAEALDILRSLRVSGADLVARNPRIVESLTAILRRRGDNQIQSRANSMHLLDLIVREMSHDEVAALGEEVFLEVVNVVREGVSQQATKAALHVLATACTCPTGRSRVKAVNAGAVAAMVEVLLADPERRACELALVAMDQACRCAEGRAELVAHAAGVAAVAKKLLRVSDAGSERAVRVLHSVALHAATPGLVREMEEVGAVAELCLVLQLECRAKTKEKAREILRLHARAWRASPCLSPLFHLSYPSSPLS
ncbi:E3 ubiquitin-protein ligase PUB23-like [Curcuma longa]|uniref:E3 ubiquitin-protein ligase PUB23-like n=1 Tax=Curcuma longa TaxID=136217 RepID=UPI003D9F655E